MKLKFVMSILAESERGIFNAILRGEIDFVSDPWPNISSGAKDLVKKMLNSDPNQRLTAFDVLSNHNPFSFFYWILELATSFGVSPRNHA